MPASVVDQVTDLGPGVVENLVPPDARSGAGTCQSKSITWASLGGDDKQQDRFLTFLAF